jgi:hypothetical protein
MLKELLTHLLNPRVQRKSILFSWKTLILLGTLLFINASNIMCAEVKITDETNGLADDHFGISVSISGDYAIVGAYLAEHEEAQTGVTYIYYRSGATWNEQAKLTASDATGNDSFGYSVSISGDYAIVGAWENDDDGNASGSAYIFHRSGTTWSQQAKLTASDASAADNFGWSVSISGDYAIVGAKGNDDDGEASGSAYIFYRNEGDTDNWGEQALLTASNGDAGDLFGHSVSISGDNAIVGAFGDEDGGSVYFFNKDQGEIDNWGQQANRQPAGVVDNDKFGISVSIDGDYAIIGASGDGAGSAYIYYRNEGGTLWIGQAKLEADDLVGFDQFGNSVSIYGDFALVGACKAKVNSNNYQGATYAFIRNGTSWSQTDKQVASDGSAADNYGCSVSISENYAIVGSYGDDIEVNEDQGSAYIYETIGDLSLPVVLSTFTAQYIENTPTIHWSTQSETDNMGWLLYRNIENDFSSSEVISDMIEGHGTTTQQQNYVYEDRIQEPEVSSTFYYWLESIDYSGMIHHYDKVAILTIHDNHGATGNLLPEPERFGLLQNEPNPVVSSTRIAFNLTETAQVDLAIYNLKGQLVKILYSGNTSKHTIMWDGKDEHGKELENGVYLYKININGSTAETKKLILMK